MGEIHIMQLLPTIIIVSVLGFFIALTLFCIVWHWRKSRIPYSKRQSLNAYRRSPVRRLTIQGGRVVDISNALEKAGLAEDIFLEKPYPILKAFVESENDPPSPNAAHREFATVPPSSDRAGIEAQPRSLQPSSTSDDAQRAPDFQSRDVHTVAIPPAFMSSRSGSIKLPRPALINIEKKSTPQPSGSSRERNRDRNKQETSPNERRSWPKSNRARLARETQESTAVAAGQEADRSSRPSRKHGRQRSSAPEPRVRKSAASSRVVSQTVQPSITSQSDGPSLQSSTSPSRHASSYTSLGPPTVTPRSSSYSARRPPPLNLNTNPTSPATQPRLSLVPPSSQRGSSYSAKRPPPLDLKTKSKSSSLRQPSPLGPESKPSSPLARTLSPVSPNSPIASAVAQPSPPPTMPLPPKPMSPKASKPPLAVSGSRASSTTRPSPLNLKPESGTHVRFGPNREAFLSATTSPMTLSPSTIDSPAPIIRAPPPSITDLPLYRTPPPPTPGELEAELMPEMVARLDRPPSLDVDIPHTSTFSFLNASTPSDPPHSGDLRRGPSVMSNRSGITIASSEISSNWTIGNAQLVNIYPSIGDAGGGLAEGGGRSSAAFTLPFPQPPTSVPGSGNGSGSGSSSEDRHTPPYAQTLRSKYGRYPRGRRDKALPTLPKSPLSMSFGLDYDDYDKEKGKEKAKEDEGSAREDPEPDRPGRAL